METRSTKERIKDLENTLHNVVNRLNLIESKEREQKEKSRYYPSRQEISEPSCKKCGLKVFTRSSGECYSCDPM